MQYALGRRRHPGEARDQALHIGLRDPEVWRHADHVAQHGYVDAERFQALLDPFGGALREAQAREMP